MSEINSIANGSFVLGNTNELTFSAGQGIKIDSPSEGTVRIGNDETVLWSGDATNGATISLSEPYSAFQYLGIEVYDNYGWGYNKAICPTNKISAAGSRAKTFDSSYTFIDRTSNTFCVRACDVFFSNNEYISATLNTRYMGITTAGAVQNAENPRTYLSRIVGINRISGSNA